MVAAVVLTAIQALPAQQPQATHATASSPRPLSLPIDYYKLANGLKVVLSRDTTSPDVVVAVYYGVGFRTEPRGRTGFAHLFEHMMFQGSTNLGKMDFLRLVQSNGGDLNGTTRFDYTNFFETVPANALEPILWAEADRMKGLSIDSARLANQRDVVKNEVRVNVLNAPYGGFRWLEVPIRANTNWQNAHNFYGDFADLDAASIDQVQDFFHTYYAPNNAVLVVAGDIDTAQARRWIDQYFTRIPRVLQPPPVDVSEPPQLVERRSTKVDALAKRPAIGIAYHVPPRNTPEWYAFGLLDQLLAQGPDSRLYDALVRQRGLTGGIVAGINPLGTMYDVNGPTLWVVSAVHDTATAPDSLLAVFERVLTPLREAPVDRATIDRAVLKIRSALINTIENASDIGRAGLLASFALFDDDPGRINRLEAAFAKVTPALLQRTAQEYLVPTNRTVVTVIPGAPSSGHQ